MNKRTIASISKGQLVYGALTVVAGLLTAIALICLVSFYYTVPGLSGNSSGGVTGGAKVAGSQNKQTSSTANVYGKSISQSPDAVQHTTINAGSASGNGNLSSGVESVSDPAAGGGSAAGGGGNSFGGGSSAVSTGGGGSGTDTSGGNGANTTGGNGSSNNGNDNSISSSAGSGADSTGGNGVSPNNGGSNAGASPGNGAPTETRIKSACFGGDNHCYVDRGQ